MVGDVGDHRPDDAELVDDSGHVRKDFADFDAVAAVFPEGEGGPHQGAGGELGARGLVGQRLAVVLVEHRLAVEGIDLGEPALQEHDNDVFGLGSEVRRFGRPGVAGDRDGSRGETGHPQAGAELLQRLPARQR